MTARYLPASALKLRDVIISKGLEVELTDVRPGTNADGKPEPGMVQFTTSANTAFSVGGSTRVQIVGLTS